MSIKELINGNKTAAVIIALITALNGVFAVVTTSQRDDFRVLIEAYERENAALRHSNNVLRERVNALQLRVSILEASVKFKTTKNDLNNGHN